MSRDDTQKRAEQAATILESPVMHEARQALRDKVYNTWVGCTDEVQRDKLHSIAVANEELWKVLNGYLRTGDVELSNVAKLKAAKL